MFLWCCEALGALTGVRFLLYLLDMASRMPFDFGSTGNSTWFSRFRFVVSAFRFVLCLCYFVGLFCVSCSFYILLLACFHGIFTSCIWDVSLVLLCVGLFCLFVICLFSSFDASYTTFHVFEWFSFGSHFKVFRCFI